MLEPKVRFKRDDGNSYSQWEEVALGDIATRITRKNSNGETDRPLTIASIEGLVDQRIYFGKTVASKDMSGYFLLKNGEYAYNKSYSAGFDYGSIKRLDKYDMGALSTLYICFALNNDQNSDFYNCYFNGLSWYNQMGEICAEGARNHGLLNVSATDFFKIKMSVPTSQEEQQKIANFLSSVDGVIAASEQEVANLETQKKAVMKKIFSQGVRFKRKDGTDFPEWTSIQLGECFSFKNGVNASRDAFRSDGIKCIGVSDVYKCMPLLSQNIKGTVSLSAAEITRYAVEYGDILFQRSSETFEDIGHASVYVDNDKAVFNGFVICAKPNKLFYNPHFLHYIMQSDDIRSQTIRLGAGAQHYNIGQDSLSSLIVLFPSLDEQRLIADFLSDFDEAIAAAKKELDLWKELKKGLLQQMFV